MTFNTKIYKDLKLDNLTVGNLTATNLINDDLDGNSIIHFAITIGYLKLKMSKMTHIMIVVD